MKFRVKRFSRLDYEGLTEGQKAELKKMRSDYAKQLLKERENVRKAAHGISRSKNPEEKYKSSFKGGKGFYNKAGFKHNVNESFDLSKMKKKGSEKAIRSSLLGDYLKFIDSDSKKMREIVEKNKDKIEEFYNKTTKGNGGATTPPPTTPSPAAGGGKTSTPVKKDYKNFKTAALVGAGIVGAGLLANAGYDKYKEYKEKKDWENYKKKK